MMIKMNTDEFQETISCGKPVLVEFYAPWCVYCRRLAPILEKISEQYADTLLIGQIDIDQELTLSEQEQIEIVPTLVLYQSGLALGSVVAPESKLAVETFLQDTAGF